MDHVRESARPPAIFDTSSLSMEEQEVHPYNAMLKTSLKGFMASREEILTALRQLNYDSEYVWGQLQVALRRIESAAVIPPAERARQQLLETALHPALPAATNQTSIPPPELCCPITHEVMTDPVLLVGDGNTYERSAIENWFHMGRLTSPLTGEVLEGDDLRLVRNMALTRQISDHILSQSGS